MLRSTLILISCLSLPALAKADKFHLGASDEAKKTEGNAKGRSVEGVLLREEKGMYVIRVRGGEISLPKSQVTRIEKDGLTVAQLENQEKEMGEALAQQNENRRQLLAAERAVESDARVAEASASRRGSAENGPRTLQIEVDFRGLLPSYKFKTFDPVLNRTDLSGLRALIENYLRVQVEKAANRR